MLVCMEIAKKPLLDESDVLDLCCGGKKCPVLIDDGDAIVIRDADQIDGEIRLSKEHLASIIPWLSKRAPG